MHGQNMSIGHRMAITALLACSQLYQSLRLQAEGRADHDEEEKHDRDCTLQLLQ